MLGTATKLQAERQITLSGAVEGNASFDGSKNITIDTTQNNIALLTGNDTIEGSANKTIEIDYPDSFNESNCYPISCGIKAVEYAGYNFEGTWQNSASFVKNAFNRSLNLTSNKIQLTIYNSLSDSTNFKYKIILMKL